MVADGDRQEAVQTLFAATLDTRPLLALKALGVL